MDEMAALREFRGAVRAPDGERLAAARARVVSAGDDPGSRRERARSLAHRGHWRAPAVAGVSVVAAAIAVLVAVGIVGPGGTAAAPPANAAVRVLQRAAAAALNQPVLRGGQFLYTSTAVAEEVALGMKGGSPAWVHSSSVQRMWQSADGSLPGVLAVGNCRVAGRLQPRCQARIRIPASRGKPVISTYAGLRSLPDAPGALLAYLEGPYACPLPALPVRGRTVQLGRYARAWDAIASILVNIQVMPPRLGYALFHAAARIPGVVLLPGVVDSIGQRGIAVARAGSFLRTELIFAAHSYRFIGTQLILTRPSRGLQAGTVLLASSLLQSRAVTSAPAAGTTGQLGPSSCPSLLAGMYVSGSSGSAGGARSPSPSSGSSSGSGSGSGSGHASGR